MEIAIQEENGRFYLGNASLMAFNRIEKEFAGAAEEAGFSSEAEMQDYMLSIRQEVRGINLRIMLDTNILVSAIFFPSTQTRTLVAEIVSKYNLVLCDYVLEKLRLVAERKFPVKTIALEYFFSALRFELLHTSKNADYSNIPSVRDNKDTPILATAIQHNIDIFLTGDKDFLVLDIDKPQIMNVTDFISRYV